MKETVLVPPVIDSSKMKHGPVPVYFATQTATAQRYAYELVEAAQEKSIYCKPANFKDLDVCVADIGRRTQERKVRYLYYRDPL